MRWRKIKTNGNATTCYPDIVGRYRDRRRDFIYLRNKKKMNNRERYEFLKLSQLTKVSAEDWIKEVVDLLLESLYIPVIGREGITVTDPRRLAHFDIDQTEPVNWGALSCAEVRTILEPDESVSYLITIEEASPKGCPTLCRYIAEYMKSYGWEVTVETEW